MLKIIFKLKEGIFGTLLLTLLFPFVSIFLIEIPFQLGPIERIAPLYFLSFLLIPYLQRSSAFVGGFLGSIIYGILMNVPITLAVMLGVILGITLFIYKLSFDGEPESKTHIFLNSISLFFVGTFIAWVLALTNSVFSSVSFIQYFNAYFYFGVISNLVIVNLLTVLYGIKISASTRILRK